MLMVIDVGNTNVVIGIYNQKNLENKFRLKSDRLRTSDEFKILIHQFLLMNSIDINLFEGVVISSVVPTLTNTIKNAVKFLKKRIIIVGEPNIKTNLVIKIDNPAQMGEDRIVTAIAARERFGNNIIIIDFGTATTFDVIGKNGEHLGGAIAPGINLSSKALSNAAAKLPEINIYKQKTAIGKSTISAMNAGLYIGYVGLVKEIIQRIKNEQNDQKMKVYATGGLANILIDEIDDINEVAEDLTIEGLLLIWEINK